MDWHTHINNIHWGDCCLTISLDLKGKDYQITGNPALKNFGYCTTTFMHNARFLSPNVLFLIFWNDCYGRFFDIKSSATTPFYCLKFTPFCGRHSFLLAVCRWIDGWIVIFVTKSSHIAVKFLLLSAIPV